MESLSAVTLGTMRFLDKGLSISDVRSLFDCAKDLGASSLHISSEYNSYELVKAARPGSKHQFIVKIAAPHFDENCFSRQSLEAKVDKFLIDFSLDSIDVAQWMWRMNPLNDDKRIERTQDQVEVMKQAFDALVMSGKVKQFSCFPYTPRYIQVVRDNGLMHSQSNYLNLWENDLLEGGIEKDSIVLRALGAGKCRNTDSALLEKLNTMTGSNESSLLPHCLRYALSHPYVKSAVISMHNVSEVEEITAISRQVEKSDSIFDAYCGAAA